MPDETTAGDTSSANGGGGNTPNPLLTIPKELVPEEWRDHVRDLRRENKTLREKLEGSDRVVKDAVEAAMAGAKVEFEKTIGETRKASDERLIRSELKAAAAKAGMVDLDGLKLADLSGVKLNDAGEVEGGDAAIESLKKAKPYLFGATGTTTSTTTAAATTKEADSRPKKAADLSADEWESQKKQFGLR